MSLPRVAILISGGGSNMLRLAEDMQAGGYAEPVLVLSNRPEAGGLAKAQARGIATRVVDHRAYRGDREAFDAALISEIVPFAPDLICLAGFMRILTPVFIDRFAGRILNIHPSLLPKYKGLDTHQRALDAGDLEAGCSVHEVTAGLDDGPVVLQARVPIEPGDTADSLAARVLTQEHRIYPLALRAALARRAEG